MNAIVHINISVFPMILLAIIFVSMRMRTIQTTDNRLFRELLQGTFLLLLTELLSWSLDGLPGRWIYYANWITNTAYFALIPMASVLWLNYVYFHLHRKLLISSGFLMKLLIIAPIASYYLILASTPWIKLIFEVDAQNFYKRGLLFFIPTILCTLYMLTALVFELIAAHSENAKHQRVQFSVFSIFTVIPIAASVIQALFPTIWVALPCTAIAELLIYMYLQRLVIKKDALTGVYNRGSFDEHLKNQLEVSTKRRSLCLFMLDLDHFKTINDTCGHDVGDEALIQTAYALSNLLYGTDAFLARYGGDEFCVTKRCASAEEAEHTVIQLQEALKNENTAHKGYTLSCSVGYCLLTDDSEIHTYEMIRRADEMLYENKKRR